MGKTAQSIVEIGLKLTEVRDQLKEQYGAFTKWLRHEFNWGHTTAYRFMQVAEKFGSRSNLVQLAPSALYLLSEPSVPDDVVEEASKKAEAGEKVTQDREGART